MNKEFPETKFREGYDKDDVDDFLDRVYYAWKELNPVKESTDAGIDLSNMTVEELLALSANVSEEIARRV